MYCFNVHPVTLRVKVLLGRSPVEALVVSVVMNWFTRLEPAVDLAFNPADGFPA
jgi:hypothetical protein